MLQRSTPRTLRQFLFASLRVQCPVCTCRCGVTIPQDGNPRRTYATQRQSPATRRARATITKEQTRTLPRTGENDEKHYHRHVRFLHRAGYVEASPDDAVSFLRHFDSLSNQNRGRLTVEPDALKELHDDFKVSARDAYWIAHSLRRDQSEANRFRGKQLLLSLSRAGNADATILVMSHAVAEARLKPRVLKSSEITYSREHLAKLAAEGLHFRAMVLEGKVAHAQGNEDYAIKLWTGAVKAAVAEAEHNKQLKSEGDTLADAPAENHRLELSTPWIELMLLHFARSQSKGKPEMKQCLWAIEVGCQQEDPTSHYWAASFKKRENEHGEHLATSDWLYHMFKAASSGHQKACHELGVFYAESGWKYLEDEPPDHVKPTPFDSYPASGGIKSTWTTLRKFVGLADTTRVDEKDSLFHLAIFPHTAEQRYHIALYWLGAAMDYFYAPSFLFKARMHLRKDLWANAAAPQAAVDLAADRYTYADRGDYEAHKDDPNPEPVEREGPPNPFYNLYAAQNALRQVFYACEAEGQAAKARAQYLTNRGVGAAEVYSEKYGMVVERSLLLTLPIRLQKWFWYREVREMYEDELPQLYAEAKAICDEMQWDMYDDEGGLLYRANARRSRAQKSAAAAVAA